MTTENKAFTIYADQLNDKIFDNLLNSSHNHLKDWQTYDTSQYTHPKYNLVCKLLTEKGNTQNSSIKSWQYYKFKDNITKTLNNDVVFNNIFHILKKYYTTNTPTSSININFTILSLWYNFLYKYDTVNTITTELRNRKIEKLLK